MNATKLLNALAGAGLCAVGASSPVAAQDMGALLQEIEALKSRIQQLERQVRANERTSEAAAQEARAAAEEAQQGYAEQAKQAAAEGDGDHVDIGGALRFNYVYRDFSEASKSRGGDGEFDLFRLDVNGSLADVLISAQYRWYSFQDVIHHGWIGYQFTQSLQGQLGITQVPFGILPYASHNWWFGAPYYAGFEDDYDMGLKFIHEDGPLNLQAAFFKNEEWGNSGKVERYSFDILTDPAQNQFNEEINQVNTRAAYTLSHGALGSTELGVSGQWSQLYNTATDDHGDHWAAAAHLDGHYGKWNLQFEAGYYDYNPENPLGVSRDTVLGGFFGVTYPIASEATFLVANIARDIPFKLGPISKLTCYNDYSIVMAESGSGDDTQINTLGCLIHAGPVFAYVDLILGKNAVFLGAPNGSNIGALAGDEWQTRFNINVGYYF